MDIDKFSVTVSDCMFPKEYRGNLRAAGDELEATKGPSDDSIKDRLKYNECCMRLTTLTRRLWRQL
jgi:hypothetical protein